MLRRIKSSFRLGGAKTVFRFFRDSGESYLNNKRGTETYRIEELEKKVSYGSLKATEIARRNKLRKKYIPYRRKHRLNEISLPQTKAEAEAQTNARNVEQALQYTFLNDKRLGHKAHHDSEEDIDSGTLLDLIRREPLHRVPKRNRHAFTATALMAQKIPQYEIILDDQQAKEILREQNVADTIAENGKNQQQMGQVKAGIRLKKEKKSMARKLGYMLKYTICQRERDPQIVMAPVVKKLAIEAYKKAVIGVLGASASTALNDDDPVSDGANSSTSLSETDEDLPKINVNKALQHVKRIHSPHTTSTTLVGFKSAPVKNEETQSFPLDENDGIFMPLLCELALAVGIGPTHTLTAQLEYHRKFVGEVRCDTSSSTSQEKSSLLSGPKSYVNLSKDTLRLLGNIKRCRSPLKTQYGNVRTARQLVENLQVVQFVSEHSPIGTVRKMVNLKDAKAQSLVDTISTQAQPTSHSFPTKVDDNAPETAKKLEKTVPQLVVATHVNPQGETVKKIVTLVNASPPTDITLAKPPDNITPYGLYAQNRLVFQSQAEEATKSYKHHLTQNSKLLHPAILEELLKADGFQPITLHRMPHGVRIAPTVEGTRRHHYSLPHDMHTILMRKMLQRLHELPEVKQIMEKMGLGHLDIRKHVFRDPRTNSIIIHLQRIQLMHQKKLKYESKTDVAIPFSHITFSNWRASLRDSIAKQLGRINGQLKSVNGEIRRCLNSDGTVAVSRKERVDKMRKTHDFWLDKYRLFKEMLYICDHNCEENNPKAHHLVPKVVAHYLLHRHDPSAPETFAFLTKDEEVYQNRLQREEVAFVEKLCHLLSQKQQASQGLKPHDSDEKATHVTIRFGKTGTFDCIIEKYPKLSQMVWTLEQQYLNPANPHPTHSSTENNQIMLKEEKLKLFILSCAVTALVATMAFAPIELMADLRILSSWNELQVRRWRAMGSAETQKMDAAVEEEKTTIPTNTKSDLSLLTALEQRDWRSHCLHRLFGLAWHQWTKYSTISEWLTNSHCKAVEDHWPTLSVNVAETMHDITEANPYLCSEILKVFCDEPDIPSIVNKLREIQPYRLDRLATIIERAYKFQDQNKWADSNDTHQTETHPESLFTTIKNAFVGFSVDQMTVYHNFDTLVNDLNREVKLTAALRLVILDAYPEFALFFSPRALTNLRDEACYEYQTGILCCHKSLSPDLTVRGLRRVAHAHSVIRNCIGTKLVLEDIPPSAQQLYQQWQHTELWLKEHSPITYFSKLKTSDPDSLLPHLKRKKWAPQKTKVYYGRKEYQDNQKKNLRELRTLADADDSNLLLPVLRLPTTPSRIPPNYSFNQKDLPSFPTFSDLTPEKRAVFEFIIPGFGSKNYNLKSNPWSKPLRNSKRTKIDVATESMQKIHETHFPLSAD